MDNKSCPERVKHDFHTINVSYVNKFMSAYQQELHFFIEVNQLLQILRIIYKNTLKLV